DPHTPVATLESLLSWRHPEAVRVRRALAANPNMPAPALLDPLAGEEPLAVAANPALPLAIMVDGRLLEHLPDQGLLALLRLEQCPDWALELARSRAQGGSGAVGIAVALHVRNRQPQPLLSAGRDAEEAPGAHPSVPSPASSSPAQARSLQV